MFKIFFKSIIFILSTIIILTLTACSDSSEQPATQEQLNEYIKNTLHVTNYDIAETSYTSYYYRAWLVTMNDEPKLSFSVYETKDECLSSVSYGLYSDYFDELTYYLVNNYDGLSLIHYTKRKDLDYNNTTLEATYSSRKELESVFFEANLFMDYIIENGYYDEVKFYFNMNPYIHDAYFTLTTSEVLDDYYIKTAAESCLHAALRYDLDSWIKDFSEEEITNAVNNSDLCIGICRDDFQKDSFTYYTDILAASSNTICSKTLYKILMKEEYPLEGDINNYRFTGVDGTVHEISHVDNIDSTDIDISSQYDCNSYSLEDIYEMSGLSLCINSINAKPNDDLYAEDGNIYTINDIYINDTLIVGVELPGNKTFSIYYNPELKEYIIPSDVGYYDNDYPYPKIIKTFVNVLDGKYGRKNTNAVEDNIHFDSTWTIGNDTWVMTADCDESISNVIVTKNDKKIDFTYASDGSYGDCPEYCICVTLDEFVKLFDLTYTIDQESGSIYFVN